MLYPAMDAIIQHASALHGSVAVPPDKAICHRAVLAAALARGVTEIRPWPSADDCQRTLTLVEQLGVPVSRAAEGIRIEGVGLDGLKPPADELDCGDSGTTMRLGCGLLAGQSFTSRLRAGPSLSRRPMLRIVEPLEQMGARIEARRQDHEVYPPLTIRGRRPLSAIRYAMPVASAQVKSAILFAGLSADGPTEIVERVPTRDHTERMLRLFGATIRAQGLAVSIEPGPLTSPGVLGLPGDFSSAAFFLVAASCVAGSTVTLERVGLNPSRTGLVEVLKRMGACVTVTASHRDWEPRGTLTVESRPLRAVTIEPGEVPGLIDELPILMVAAACASGTSRFDGIGELRVKETDRMQSMARGLRRLGVPVSLPGPETIVIEGGSLAGAVVESAGDHRIAMSLAVAGLAAQGTTTVKDVACAAKSFPEFFDQLRALAGSSTVKTGKSVDKPGGVC